MRSSIVRKFQTEKSNGRLKVRSRQALLHHVFTDFRIEDLEKELKQLKKDVYKLDESVGMPGKARFPVHRHELLRQSVRLPCSQQPALEVKVQERVTPITVDLSTNHGPEVKIQEREQLVSDKCQGNELHTSERLRIRSYSLLTHLENISGNAVYSLAQRSKIQEEMVHGGVVFLRPFKLFVRHESLIRDSLKELEDKVREGATTDGSTNAIDPKLGKARQRGYEDKNLLEDLKLLVNDLFDADVRSTFELRQMIDAGTALEIEYGDLWHLFSRGDIVLLQSDQTHARRVVNLAGGRERLRYSRDNEEQNLDGFIVDCLSLGADGSSYIPKLEKIAIKQYVGKRKITTLSVYPLRFDPREAELRTEFAGVGRRLLDLTSHSFCHKTVRGKTLDEPSHELDAQVIVDTTLALTTKSEWRLDSSKSTDDFTKRDGGETEEQAWCQHRGEGCCGGDVIFKDLKYDDMDAATFNGRMMGMLGPLQAKDLTDEDSMVMQPYVYAFVLRSRQWVKVRTSDLHDVVFENSFKDLVIPDEHKETVTALVETHENTRASHLSADFRPSIGSALDLVKGKGSGLIILLHGPPGVGKTSTAECVADDTKRPLYPITCGDIGETAAEVESSLQYNFRLAHKWGCVLLLDEADIFLAKRTRSDIRHNAVTSVFLRSLEYYAGILFLTSNRVGAIDPAFKSRIKMSLSYPKLNLSVTTQLYQKFIDRARAEQDATQTHHFKIRDKEILASAKKHFIRLEREIRETWNGRQIRNAFQTAIALVEYQYMTKDADEPKPSLGKKQFKSVAQGSREFDDYLHSVLGSTEAEVARQDAWRDDGYLAAPATMGMDPLAASQRSQAAWSARSRQAGKRVPQVSESDEFSDSDTEEDNANEGDKEKKQSATEGPAATATVEAQSAGTYGGPIDREQFQKFLKIQDMMAKQSL
ncbi:P-loop containing nucleoside triphosphate hydrolase protein [Colletotrichum caudatum]|nr:P-loop containing nucleoside triphosphate hydrolase protein [Colletotrichum caudatum]